MTITVHHGDVPADLDLGAMIAVDTETLGLRIGRDRLCLVQLSGGDGTAHLVRIERGRDAAPNLKRLLENPQTLKLFHYARFDLAILFHSLGITAAPVYCTKVASKLVRTYTDRHGLKDLCRELLGREISKQEQTSDWGAEQLTQAQQEYAARDVLHLHELKAALDAMLVREGRMDLAQACFQFLPVRAKLVVVGWADEDIFEH